MKGKTLVAYFSAQGTTKEVAKIIAKHLEAELYEIVPAEAYSDADLDWTDRHSRSSIEMRDSSSRPEMKGDIDISSYDNILLGFPIWWGEEPHIVDTFLEAHDFSGKKIIPFATSGGSGIAGAEMRLKSICPKANIEKGKRLYLSTALSWALSL